MLQFLRRVGRPGYRYVVSKSQSVKIRCFHQTIIKYESHEERKSHETTVPSYRRELWYPAKKGEIVHSRYKIIEKLGYGWGATAWLCRDLKSDTPTYSCMKILANGTEARELQVQQHLANIHSSYPEKQLIGHFQDTFLVNGPSTANRCFIYPLASTDMQNFHDDKARTSDDMHFKWLFKQLLLALDYLHVEADVIHTDIKLNSIMLAYGEWDYLAKDEKRLVSGDYFGSAKRVVDNELIIYGALHMLPTTNHGATLLCDFGQARIGDVVEWDGEVQPQLMRAREVVMHMPWNHKIDIWSAGCLLWNLFRDQHLFENVDPKMVHDKEYMGWNNGETHIYKPIDARKYIAAITSLLGVPPPEYISRAPPFIYQFFSTEGQRLHEETHALIKTSFTELEGGHDRDFVDMVQSMLRWLPEERKSARELLNHPFLRGAVNPRPKPFLPYDYAEYDYEELQKFIKKKPNVCW